MKKRQQQEEQQQEEQQQNNMSVDIKQNVSPLKQRQSSRGGKSAGRATATSGRRGGFAKSSGKRGAGGRNVGGYNVLTSFVTPPAWKKPPSGGTITPVKPYKIDDKGKVVMREPGNTNTTTNIYNYGDKSNQQSVDINNGDKDKKTKKATTTEYGETNGRLPTYREAWSANKDNVRNIYDSLEDYENDMLNIKPGDKRDIEREKKRKEAEEKKTYEKSTFEVTEEKNDDNDGININMSAFQMRGNPMYRNFGIGGKPKK